MDIRKWALLNAIQFKGKASHGAVIGKVIQEHPEAKKNMKGLAKDVAKIIKEVNTLSLKQQQSELQSRAPELLKEKPKEKQDLKPLPHAEGKVVFRLAPEPSKYLHIGHALIFMIQHLYCKRYKGTMYLRVEDTNPEKCRQEFVDAIVKDLTWLGLSWNKKIIVSEHLELFYEYAEQLLRAGHAYICSCTVEDMRTLRMQKRACLCRKNNTTSEWKKMLEGKVKQGEKTVRLVGDMKSDNGVLRDPVIFRINNTPHYKQGTAYHVWPTYDFENAVADSHWKITHVIRSKEFELRQPLQELIRLRLGLKGPTIIEIGRFNIHGAETQGRKIRAMIESGEVTGWDDPRLVTVQALRRRGFLPATIEEMAKVVGLGRIGGKIDFKVLSTINRKIVDPIAPRYFFIRKPKLVTIQGAPTQTVELHLHPDQKKGGRKMKAGPDIFIEEEDFIMMKQGEEYRLIECFNFRKDKMLVFTSRENKNFSGKKRIHWLPARENTKASVMMPDGEVIHGLAEKGVQALKEGDILQFERFGFCRLDNKKTLHFRYTHA